jgi:hypothetical protein
VPSFAIAIPPRVPSPPVHLHAGRGGAVRGTRGRIFKTVRLAYRAALHPTAWLFTSSAAEGFGRSPSPPLHALGLGVARRRRDQQSRHDGQHYDTDLQSNSTIHALAPCLKLMDKTSGATSSAVSLRAPLTLAGAIGQLADSYLPRTKAAALPASSAFSASSNPRRLPLAQTRPPLLPWSLLLPGLLKSRVFGAHGWLFGRLLDGSGGVLCFMQSCEGLCSPPKL